MARKTMTLPPSPSVTNGKIGSVQRALNILELLAEHPDGLNAKQIAFHLDLNISTCYHLLNTLIAGGYVVKEVDSRLFYLSGKIGYTVHGQASPAQLVQQLRPHVLALQETTHETAYLSVWDGEEITLSAIAESPLSVRVKSLTIGYTEANHAMALGKSILAFLDEFTLDDYLNRHPPVAYTSNTITNIPDLKQHLTQVRQQGYSLDLEEYLPDVYCISAPVFDALSQVVASLAISLPGHRYQANHPTLIAQVKQAGQAASRALYMLGYARPTPVTR